MPISSDDSLVERREHPRLPRHGHSFVQLGGPLAADQVAGQAAAMRRCDVLDSSPSGLCLRLHLAEALPRHSPLQLWVSPAGVADKYHLFGRVVWCCWKPGRAVYELGVELHDEPGSDQHAWAQLFG